MPPIVCRVLKQVLFLVPIAYVAMLFCTAVHELAGHGLAALAVGGRFDGFTIHWAAGGNAMAWASAGSPAWQAIVVLSAGIGVTAIAGTALCFWATRRKSDSAAGQVVALLGLFQLVSALPYAFESALQNSGPGDPAQILKRLAKAGCEHVDVVRNVWVAASGILWLLAQWWSVRIMWRPIETNLGGGRALSRGRRAAFLVGLILVPGLVYIYATASKDPSSEAVKPHVYALSLLATTAPIVWFPLRPFPIALRLRPRHFVGAWVALGLVASCMAYWSLPEGVRWNAPAVRERSTEADALVDSLQDAETIDEVTRLEAKVSDSIARDPILFDGPHLLTTLGFSWQRVGEPDRALAAFERIGRDWPDQGTISLLCQVQLLSERGSLDEAASRATRFVATARGHEQNIGLSVLASVEEKRGRWREALSATERWVPADDDPPFFLESNAKRIARCRFHLDGIEVARAFVAGLPAGPSRDAASKELDEIANPANPPAETRRAAETR